MDLDRKGFNSPVKGFLVGGEEDVEAVIFNCAASVEDFDGFVVVVTGDYHFSAEWVSPVGGNEGLVGLDFVA